MLQLGNVGGTTAVVVASAAALRLTWNFLQKPAGGWCCLPDICLDSRQRHRPLACSCMRPRLRRIGCIY